MKLLVMGIITTSLFLGTVLTGCTNTKAPTTPSAGTNNLSPTPREGTADKAQRPANIIKVITSISVLADIIHQVGQDRVIVKTIVPAGADPHTFQPTPQDVREISEGSIIFVNGMGLEGPIENLIRASGKSSSRIIVLSDGLQPQAGAQQDQRGNEGDDNSHIAGNPHLWLDVSMTEQYVQHIEKELASIDPAGASIYEKNANKYLSELNDLDKWIKQQIGTIPQEKRKLVTFHDAFPYYAKRYGLDLVGVVLRSPDREPSAREIADLVDRVKRENVRTVFAEPQFNARVLEVVAREAGVKVATLYSDTTDNKITGYSAMMRYNTEQIVNGLR